MATSEQKLIFPGLAGIFCRSSERERYRAYTLVGVNHRLYPVYAWLGQSDRCRYRWDFCLHGKTGATRGLYSLSPRCFLKRSAEFA